MHAKNLLRLQLFFGLTVSLLLVSLLPAIAGSEPAPVDALRIGTIEIAGQDFQALSAAIRSKTGNGSFAEEPALLKQFVETRLLAESARRNGVPTDPEIRARLSLAQDDILAQAEHDRIYNAVDVTDAGIERRLAERPGAYDEITLSHIFIAVRAAGADPARPEARSDAEALDKAQSVRRALLAGLDFAAAALRESDDRATAGSGGRVDPMLGMYVAPEFASAVFALKEGEISEPVHGSGGYHLVQLIKRVRADPRTNRGMVEAVLRGEAVQRELDAMLRLHPVALSRASATAPKGSRAVKHDN